MNNRLGVGLGLLTLGSCALYGDPVGPPPGPVPGSWAGEGAPEAAGALAPVTGHGAQVVIAAGVYEGDLVIEGNGNNVAGAGHERTIVRGALLVRGDANVVHSIHVLEPSRIEGDENDVRGTVFEQGIEASGEANLLP